MHASEPVNRLMSQPVLQIAADASIADAARLFMEHSVHHLPVLEQGRLVGILSAADVMGRQFQPDLGDQSALEVRHLMSAPVQRVAEHDSVQRAVALMIHGGVHALPVVNSADMLVGILTTSDVMLRCFGQPPARSTDIDTGKIHPLSAERVAAAISSARNAVSAHRDPLGIAATLLLMQTRVNALQAVVSAAKRFLNAGQDEQLHSALLKAIEHSERLDEQWCQPFVIGIA